MTIFIAFILVALLIGLLMAISKNLGEVILLALFVLGVLISLAIPVFFIWAGVQLVHKFL